MKEKKKKTKINGSYLVMAILVIVLVYLILPKGEDEKKVGQDNPPSDAPPGYKEYSERIKWIWNDVDAALTQARNENKYVLIDFWASWCGWCEKADREVFPDRRVEDIILSNFVPVKVDADTHPQLQTKYKVRGLPTVVILDGDGNVKGQIVGYHATDEFISLLAKYTGG